MSVLFVDQLTVIDFSFFHPHRGIVGESWILDVELEGELDDNGMVFDFAHVKKQIKAHVDQLIDHKFVFPQHYAQATIKQEDDELIIECQDLSQRRFRHVSPTQAVALVPVDSITPESVTPFLKEHLLRILPDNVKDLQIALRTEKIDGPYYHYSHGLKKHFGDCQRIAHGHRSKIEVWQDGVINAEQAQIISEEWEDIYLITEEDIKQEDNFEGIDYTTVSYTSNQGYFELQVPTRQCDVMKTDSTVELIAQFLANRLKQRHPNNHFKVKAYEGVQKGAIAEA
ncbi:6-carboxytetrahydropterin synthase [Pleionea sp. CnH1-48]|uniref:6-pyruvoyl trahydropterin synthase family protein n=1 Tax=Pleionea sp. CnH1-48 TaxID=2954494 RepID=UPI002098476F|nr:6-carboxytetrahydropterin synthase [Pleionea sp. CnH1-48]MCO7222685.1 6-carboxytetrahydropterin synthase [Pleionea sp. CnH1-48]